MTEQQKTLTIQVPEIQTDKPYRYVEKSCDPNWERYFQETNQTIPGHFQETEMSDWLANEILQIMMQLDFTHQEATKCLQHLTELFNKPPENLPVKDFIKSRQPM